MKVEAYKASFPLFLWLVWKHLQLPEPTAVQKDIAHYLQHGPRRFLIEAFRGVGKSWITAAYVCWLLLNDPQTRIMVVSANEERAVQFAIFVKRLIREMPILRHLKPKAGDRDSNLSFDVSPARADQAPSVRAVGITGQLTGGRANVIIADDIETPKNSLTQTLRDRIAELVKEFDAVLKPGGRIGYLGTPQTEMSLYNQLPERGYEVRIWPARVPDRRKLAGYQDRLAPFIQKMLDDGVPARTPVDPERFDESDLIEREASYGRSGFALQFMLDTSLSDDEKFPLKLRDLIALDLNPDVAPSRVAWAGGRDQIDPELQAVGLAGDRWHKPMYVSPDFMPYQGAVMAIDPSGRGEDETGVAVSKFLHGQIYIPVVRGFRDGYSDTTLRAIAQIAKVQKVNMIIVEDNFGDGMFAELLKPHLRAVGHPCSIEGFKSTGQKEQKLISILEPAMNQHRVVVDRQLIEDDQKADPKYQLFYQMTRLTKDKGAIAHDDRLEALAFAVKYWVDYMAQDASEREESHREDLLKAELQKFMDQFGQGTSQASIFDAYRRRT